MTQTSITDWDDAYANAAHIPKAADYPLKWAENAASFRSDWHWKELDIPYGDRDRQRFDLFRPGEGSKGLLVFVHGGYWLRFDKSFWSHFAKGALLNGWTACLPSYDLSPTVKIAEITRQIGGAVHAAAGRCNGPIRLAGHSAGGHLVTRMICEDTPLPGEVVNRIERIVSISGLHDLRPLRKTAMNQSFNLSEEDAVDESPAMKATIKSCPVTAWVGSEERPEFVRQSRLLADAWADAKLHLDPGKHHFNVIDGLLDPDSDLTVALLSS